MINLQRIPFPCESDYPVPSSGTQAQDVPSFCQSRIRGYQIYPVGTETKLLPNESSFHMTAEQERELSMYRLRQMSNHEQLPVMNFNGISPVFQFDCYHSETPEYQMYPMVTEDGSPANQSRFYNKIALCKTAEQERGSSVYRLRQMSNQYQSLVMSLNRTLSANQFVSQKAFYEIAYPVADVAVPSGQVNSHGALPVHYLDPSQSQKPYYSSHESQQVNPKQIHKISSVPHRMATTLPCTSHVPMFAGGSNQRPSVIMVPISLMTTVSSYEHEVRCTYKQWNSMFIADHPWIPVHLTKPHLWLFTLNLRSACHLCKLPFQCLV